MFLIKDAESNRGKSIRWPGVPGRQIRNQLVTNLDVVATILDVAHAVPGNALDGRSFVPVIANAKAPWRLAFLVEGMFGDGNWMFFARRSMVRMYIETDSIGWGHETELYDLVTDPFQMHANRTGTGLSDELAALKRCVGDGCWIE